MQYDTAGMKTRDIYRIMVNLIAPRPIAWVSTQSDTGQSNLAPFSFFNGVGSNPPCLMFAPANRADGSKKDTLRNIESNGEFVVNLVSYSQAKAMNQTAAEYVSDISEFEKCHIAAEQSSHVQPLRVADSVASFECDLIQAIELGSGPGGANLVVGRIIAIHVKDEVIDAEGHLQSEQFDLIGRLGGTEYTRVADRFSLERPKL
jgi:flavin reductase (DIM6/NTAB) family NADH-FMN oxidoreductase RutF